MIKVNYYSSYYTLEFFSFNLHDVILQIHASTYIIFPLIFLMIVGNLYAYIVIIPSFFDKNDVHLLCNSTEDVKFCYVMNLNIEIILFFSNYVAQNN